MSEQLLHKTKRGFRAVIHFVSGLAGRRNRVQCSTDDIDSIQNNVSVTVPAHDKPARPNRAQCRAGDIQHGINRVQLMIEPAEASRAQCDAGDMSDDTNAFQFRVTQVQGMS